MKLQKAIELLRKDIKYPGSVAIEDVNKAEELGIKALKRIQNARAIGHAVPAELLPGETED